MKQNGRKLILLYATICLVGFSSCYYDIEEELYPNPSMCDTLNRSFSTHVQSILTISGCLTCHSALSQQGNIILEGYNNVSLSVNNGALLGAIRHEANFSAMPQNAAKLSDCNIANIEAWIQQGALNN